MVKADERSPIGLTPLTSLEVAPERPEVSTNVEVEEDPDGGFRILPESSVGPPMRTAMAATAIAVIAVAAAVALITRRAEVLAIAIPFVAGLTMSVSQLRRNDTTVSGVVDSLRHVEGDTVDITVRLQSTHDVEVCEVELTAPESMKPHHSLRAVTSLTGGAVHSVRFPVELATWGVIDLTEVELSVRTSDRLGVFSQRQKITGVGHLKVALHDEHIRSLIAPDHFRRLVGGHTSHDRGDGTELADVREYRPGEPQRWINWRISSRRREPWVALRHPDRSTTVVIVADLAGDDPVFQRATARATEAIARAHLGVYDKVGVFIAADDYSWVEPQLGQRQMLAISDALLEGSSGRYRRVETQAAPRAIPIEAIVIVVSPLLETGIDSVIGGLRSQGRSVLVIEPRRGFDPEWRLPSHRPTDVELAFRLSQVKAQLRRRQLTQRGIRIIPWDIGQSMEVAMREVARTRRQRGATR